RVVPLVQFLPGDRVGVALEMLLRAARPADWQERAVTALRERGGIEVAPERAVGALVRGIADPPDRAMRLADLQPAAVQPAVPADDAPVPGERRAHGRLRLRQSLGRFGLFDGDTLARGPRPDLGPDPIERVGLDLDPAHEAAALRIRREPRRLDDGWERAPEPAGLPRGLEQWHDVDGVLAVDVDSDVDADVIEQP